MFTLTYIPKSGTVRKKAKRTWRLQDFKPTVSGDIISIEASEIELKMMSEKFSNIPITKLTETCIWKAPWAQFIYDNTK